MSRYLIAERNPDGHRLQYVRALATRALESGGAVMLLLSDRVSESNEGKSLLQSHPSADSEIRQINVRNLVHAAREWNADVVVVPDGDWLVWRMLVRSWPATTRLQILVMRERGQHPNAAVQTVQSVIKGVLRFCANRRRGVTTFSLKSAIYDKKLKASMILDPIRMEVDEQSLAATRNAFSLGEETSWVAIVGAISSRKNPLLVAEAIVLTKNQNLGLVIAGEITESAKNEVEEARALLRARGHQVRVIARRLSDAELDAVVCLSHCLVLAHSNEGPSGILGKASAAGTNVIGAGARSLRKDLRRYAYGCWVPLEISDIAKALVSLQRGTVNNVLVRHNKSTETAFAERLLGIQSADQTSASF